MWGRIRRPAAARAWIPRTGRLIHSTSPHSSASNPMWAIRGTYVHDPPWPDLPQLGQPAPDVTLGHSGRMSAPIVVHGLSPTSLRVVTINDELGGVAQAGQRTAAVGVRHGTARASRRSRHGCGHRPARLATGRTCRSGLGAAHRSPHGPPGAPDRTPSLTCPPSPPTR